MDIEEFIRLYKAIIYSQNETDKYAKSLFNRFDLDKNGKISLREFLILTSFEIDTSRSDETIDFAKQTDQKTQELAYEILKSSMKIDKEELVKVPFALYCAQDSVELIDENDFDKENFLNMENEALEKDEFLKFVQTCKAIIILE